MQPTNIFREKFDALVVTGLWMLLTAIWIAKGFAPELRDFVVGLFGALLMAWGFRPRPNTQTIEAGTIGSAKTEHGNIIAGEIKSEEKAQNEI